MPTDSATVDQRIVEMRIDNEKFEAGAKKTISILESLDRSLNGIGDQTGQGLDVVTSSLEKVTDKFSIMGTIGDQILRNLTSRAMELVGKIENMATVLTTQQISAGFSKYADKTSAVQTIMAATNKDVGAGLKWANQEEQMAAINAQLERLNAFTDETSYNFLDMVSNIGKFTANGRDLEESVTAMEGIANWAAISGGRVQEASRAMYNLSQALGMGAVTVQDWKSIENANMATYEFKQMAIEAAEELGTLQKVAEGVWETTSLTEKAGEQVTVENFREALRYKWFNSDVLLDVLGDYGEFTDLLLETTDNYGITVTKFLEMLDLYDQGENGMERLTKEIHNQGYELEDLLPAIEQLADDQYDLGRRAFQAAQEAKTFAEAIDAAKDAVSTGWMNIFEKIFGDYLDAKKFWTKFANTLYDIFAAPLETLNDIADYGFGSKSNNFFKIFNEEGQLLDVKQVDTLMDFIDVITESDDAMRSFQEAAKNSNIELKSYYDNLYDIASSRNSTLDIDPIVQKYGSLSKAVEAGAISVSHLRKMMLDIINNPYIDEEAVANTFTLVFGGLDLSTFFTGGGLLRDALMNIMDFFSQIAKAVGKAMENVFGTPEMQGKTIRNLIELFWRWTKTLQMSEEQIDHLASVLEAPLIIIRTIGKVIGFVFNIASKVIRLIFSLLKPIWPFIEIILIGIGEFIDYLTELIDTAKPLQRVGNGLRKAFGWIGGHLYILADALKIIGGVLMALFGGVFSAAEIAIEKLGEWGSIIWEFLSTNEHLVAIWNSIAKAAGKVWSIFGGLAAAVKKGFGEGGAKRAFQAFVDTVKNGFGSIIPSGEGIMGFFRNLWGFIVTGFGTVGAFVVEIWNSIFGKESTDAVEEGTEKTESAFVRFQNTINKILDQLFGGPDEGKTRIETYLSNLWNWFVGFASTVKFSDIFKAWKLSIISAFLLEFTNVFTVFKSLMVSVKEIPLTIKDFFGEIITTLEGLNANFRATALLKFTVAVGILTIAIYALTKLAQNDPEDKLTHVATIIGILMILLSQMGNIFSKSKGLSSINIQQLSIVPEAAAILFGLAATIVSILLAAKAINKIGDANRIWTVFAPILVVIGALGGILIATSAILKNIYPAKLSAMAKTIAALSFAILTFTLAVSMLVAPIVLLMVVDKLLSTKIRDEEGNVTGRNNDSGIIKATLIIGAIMTAMGLLVGVFTRQMNKNNVSDKKIKEIGNTLLKISAAMVLVALAVQMLIIPILAFTALLAHSKTADAVGPAIGVIVGILGAMLLFLVLVKWLIGGIDNDTDPKTAEQSEKRIKAIGNTLLKMAASMVIVALAVQTLILPVIAMTALIKKVGWQTVLTSIGYLVLMIGIVALIFGGLFNKLTNGRKNPDELSKFGNAMLKFAAAMLVFNLAVLVLAPSLVVFASAISLLANMAKKLGLANVAIGRLLGYGAAMVLFGIGAVLIAAAFTAISISAFAFSAAMLMVAEGMSAVMKVLPDFLEKIKKLSGRDIAIISGIAIAIALLAWGLSKLLNPKKVLDGVTTVITKLGGLLKTGASNLLTGVTNFLTDPKNIEAIMKTIVTLITIVGLYVIGAIPTLTSTIVDAVLVLIDSVTRELNEHRDQFIESFTGFFKELFKILGGTLNSLFSKDFHKDLTGWEEALFWISTVTVAATVLNTWGKFATILANIASSAGIIGSKAGALGGLIGAGAGSSIAPIIGWTGITLAGLQAGYYMKKYGESMVANDLTNEVISRTATGQLDAINRLNDAQNRFNEAYAENKSMREKTNAFNSLNDSIEECAELLGVTTTELRRQMNAVDGNIYQTQTYIKWLAELNAKQEENVNLTKDQIDAIQLYEATRSVYDETYDKYNDIANDDNFPNPGVHVMAQDAITTANNLLSESFEYLAASLYVTTEELQRQLDAVNGNLYLTEAYQNALNGTAQALSNAAVASSEYSSNATEIAQKQEELNGYLKDVGLTADSSATSLFNMVRSGEVNGSALTNIFSGISSSASDASESVGSLFSQWLSGLDKGSYLQLQTEMNEAGISIGDFLGMGIGDGITKAEDYAKDHAGGMLDNLVDFLKSHMEIKSPSRVTAEVGQYMGEGIVVGMQEGIEAHQSDLDTTLYRLIQDTQTRIIPIQQDILTNTAKATDTMFTEWESRINEFDAAGLGTSTTQELGNSIAKNVTYVGIRMDKVVEAIRNSPRSLDSQMRIAGNNAVFGLIRGLSDYSQSVYNSGVYLANLVNQGFTNTLRIKSPSRVFMELAKYIPMGISIGIRDNGDYALESISILSTDMVDAANKAMAEVGYIASDMYELHPSIVPVIDTASVRGSMDNISSIFGESAMLNDIRKIMSTQNTIGQSDISIKNQNQDVVEELRVLTERVGRLGTEITNLKVVMNTGVLVGELAPGMNQALGEIMTRQSR